MLATLRTARGGIETNIWSASGFPGCLFLLLNCEHTELNAKSKTTVTVCAKSLFGDTESQQSRWCPSGRCALTQCARLQKNEKKQKNFLPFSFLLLKHFSAAAVNASERCASQSLKVADDPRGGGGCFSACDSITERHAYNFMNLHE